MKIFFLGGCGDPSADRVIGLTQKGRPARAASYGTLNLVGSTFDVFAIHDSAPLELHDVGNHLSVPTRRGASGVRDRTNHVR